MLELSDNSVTQFEIAFCSRNVPSSGFLYRMVWSVIRCLEVPAGETFNVSGDLKMKIAFLSKEYPPYGMNYAGALFFPKVVRAFAERGHQVHVITQAMGESSIDDDQGVVIHRIGPKAKSGSALSRMRYNVAAWKTLSRMARDSQLDIIDAPVTFGEGLLPTLLKERPVVLYSFAFSNMFTRTGSYETRRESLSLRVSSALEDVSLRYADRVVANSPATYRYLISQKGLQPERVEEIWEVRIDFGKWCFAQSSIRAEYNIPVNAPMVLYVGWFQARKGIQILSMAIAKVLEKHPDTVFVFVGRDPPSTSGAKSRKNALVQLARRFGYLNNIRVIESFLPEEKLIKLYSSCDTFVFPSLSETFGWPIVEAISCGRRVVATNVGIAPDLAKMGVKLRVVRPGDASGLADAIVTSLSDTGNPMIYESENRRVVKQKFSFEEMMDRIFRLHEDVLASPKR